MKLDQYDVYVESGIISESLNEMNKNYIYKICGWNNWQELVNKLNDEGQYERAACICCFNKDLDKAIKILMNASKDSSLNEYLALSIVLSCISIDSSQSDLLKITNPYLRVLFSYQSNPENFDKQIFNDSNILITDRICMALNILKIEALFDYIKNLTADCISMGNLYGIVLTGLGFECIDLFQSYIHRTSDVQTPAVSIIHSTYNTSISKYINGWIESYRELLDCWMLWEERALYDINRYKSIESNPVETKPLDLKPKIFMRCNFCGENISSKKYKKNISEAVGANMAMTCQACSKPSLRCSVCSFYMTIDPPKSAYNENKDKMAYWFVFCQKCSHGGHMGHYENWFKSSKECPVMTCHCQCYIESN